jgi:hypothetical protein
MRWSHDTKWNMDRALGLFAHLNVLPNIMDPKIWTVC